MNLVDSLYILVLILLPFHDKSHYSNILPQLKLNKGRVKYYWQGVFYLSLLGISSIALMWFGFLSIPMDSIKIDLIFNWEQTMGLSLAFGFFGVSLFSLKSIQRNPEIAMKIVTQAGDAGPMMPKTMGEERLFRLLSLSAGLFEELIFRGVVFLILSKVVGLWPALMLSSILFGWQHYYLGKTHIIKTAFVGLFMGILYHYTGTLIVPIIFHILLDIIAGLQYRTAYTVVEKVLPNAHDVAEAMKSAEAKKTATKLDDKSRRQKQTINQTKK